MAKQSSFEKIPLKRIALRLLSVLLVGGVLAAILALYGTSLQAEKDSHTVRLAEGTLILRVQTMARLLGTLADSPHLRAAVSKGVVSAEATQQISGAANVLDRATILVVDRHGRILISSSPETGFVPGNVSPGDSEFLSGALSGQSQVGFSAGVFSDVPDLRVAFAIRDQHQLPAGAIIAKTPVWRLNLFGSVPGYYFILDAGRRVLFSNATTADELKLAEGKTGWVGFLPHIVWRESTIGGAVLLFALPNKLGLYFGAFGLGVMLWVGLLIAGATIANDREDRSQARLAVSEQQYRAMFEENGVMMTVVDAESCRYLDVNEAALQFFGYSRQEFLKLTCYSLVEGGTAELGRAQLGEVRRRKNHRYELRMRCASGEVKTVEVFSVKLAHSGTDAVYNIIHDLSEKKRIEEEKEAMLGQLIHSAKLASIGTLAAGVAHEINNPLTILKGFNGTLRDELEALPDGVPDGINQTISRQDQAIDRIAKIVEGLRVYARPTIEKIAVIDIHQAIRETLVLAESLMRKAQVSVRLDLAATEGAAAVNSGKFEQVLMNLLSNARDAVENVAGKREVIISTYNEKSKIVIKVADNGSGISAGNLSRIFDAFFTTKAPGKGTGLGLAISRSIVESFGGQMGVASVPGKGTEFWISLPSVQPLSTGAVQAPPSAQALHGSGAVLIVDDEEGIRDILRGMLLRYGFTVSEAADGETALELLRTHSFKMVLLDLQLPGIQGVEVLTVAKRLPGVRDTRFLVITGGINHQLPGNKTGISLADGVLLKPFDQPALASMLRDFGLVSS